MRGRGRTNRVEGEREGEDKESTEDRVQNSTEYRARGRGKTNRVQRTEYKAAQSIE